MVFFAGADLEIEDLFAKEDVLLDVFGPGVLFCEQVQIFAVEVFSGMLEFVAEGEKVFFNQRQETLFFGLF